MLNKLKYQISLLVLAGTLAMPHLSYARGSEGAGLVLFTAIQRSKIKPASGLSFGCSTFAGKHDIYTFDFYPNSSQPFGLVKLDASGFQCDRIEMDEFLSRHSTACIAEQLNWAEKELNAVLPSLDGEQKQRMRMTVTSQIGETHWSDDWGAYLLSLFSFVSESKASEIECDFKITLETQEQAEKGAYKTLDKATFKW